MFEARTHPVTGERAFQFIDWTPADLVERESRGVVGRPLRDFMVCSDRVEVVVSWCFSSGHAEWYEDGDRAVFRRGDPELAHRFGDQVAGEIALAFVTLEMTRTSWSCPSRP